MVKSSTTSGQLDIYSQTYNHLDIWKNAIEQAADSQMSPPQVEASAGVEQYYVRSS